MLPPSVGGQAHQPAGVARLQRLLGDQLLGDGEIEFLEAHVSGPRRGAAVALPFGHQAAAVLLPVDAPLPATGGAIRRRAAAGPRRGTPRRGAAAASRRSRRMASWSCQGLMDRLVEKASQPAPPPPAAARAEPLPDAARGTRGALAAVATPPAANQAAGSYGWVRRASRRRSARPRPRAPVEPPAVLQQRVDVGVVEEPGDLDAPPGPPGDGGRWRRDRNRCGAAASSDVTGGLRRYPNSVPGRASWAAAGGVTPQCS